MIILDTNVVSEMLREAPHPAVRMWLDDQAAETLFLSTVTVGEMLFGIAALPAGKRRNTLSSSVDGMLALFEDRVLSFDVEAARHFGELAARARKKGRGFPTPDGYIAAIAASRGFSVATRDVAPFHAAGLAVINPWPSTRH